MISLYNPRDRELWLGLFLGVQREGQFSNHLRDFAFLGWSSALKLE